MDEIDGMSSNDRGGLNELMDIIFKTKIIKKDYYTKWLTIYLYF